MLRHQLWPVLAMLATIIACTLSKLTLAGSQANIRHYSQLAGLSKCFEVWEQVLKLEQSWGKTISWLASVFGHIWLGGGGGWAISSLLKPLTNWDKQIQTASKCTEQNTLINTESESNEPNKEALIKVNTCIRLTILSLWQTYFLHWLRIWNYRVANVMLLNVISGDWFFSKRESLNVSHLYQKIPFIISSDM